MVDNYEAKFILCYVDNASLKTSKIYYLFSGNFSVR